VILDVRSAGTAHTTPQIFVSQKAQSEVGDLSGSFTDQDVRTVAEARTPDRQRAGYAWQAIGEGFEQLVLDAGAAHHWTHIDAPDRECVAHILDGSNQVHAGQLTKPVDPLSGIPANQTETDLRALFEDVRHYPFAKEHRGGHIGLIVECTGE